VAGMEERRKEKNGRITGRGTWFFCQI